MGLLSETLRDGSRLIRDYLLAGEIAEKPGLLQSLEPRVKLATTLLFILTAITLKSTHALLILVGVLLALAFFSKIPLDVYLKRTWFFIPLFSAIVALPTPFLTPGTPLITTELGTLQLTASWEGAIKALQFVLRVYLSISATLLLIYTTKLTDIIGGLAGLGAPKAFTLTLSIAYRYIFLFLDELLGILTGWESRAVGKQGLKELWKGGTTGAALLLIRAYERGERVHLAMKARGYEGNPKTLKPQTSNLHDYLYASASALLCITLLTIDLGLLPTL